MMDKIPKSTEDRDEMVNLILGLNGVASADDSAEFDTKNREFKETLTIKPVYQKPAKTYENLRIPLDLC